MLKNIFLKLVKCLSKLNETRELDSHNFFTLTVRRKVVPRHISLERKNEMNTLLRWWPSACQYNFYFKDNSKTEPVYHSIQDKVLEIAPKSLKVIKILFKKGTT